MTEQTQDATAGSHALSAPSELLGPRPVAWMWMQATFSTHDVRGRGWVQSFSTLEPKGMPSMVDQLTPLYDQAALEAATEEANRRANASWALMCEKMLAAERERWIAACDAERAAFAERAANNDGRESDFAFGSVNSAERIKAAGLGA